MKLMVIIVQDVEGDEVVQALVEKGNRVTRMASTGGFLKRGNVTLLTGVEDENVKIVVESLRGLFHKRNAEQHHATIFVVDMPHYEQI